MDVREPRLRSHITLFLCMILHAFTHAYGAMFVPLYLLMTADLHLSGVKQASLLVALYTLFYCLCSYGAGLLSDRFNRKLILGIGLLGNALTVIAIGLTRQYQLLLLWAVLAGICGTLFHPAASGLVPAHYPKSPGMAIGLLGIGSGIGFFIGPQYSGWRAQVAQWNWQGWEIAQWQKPCIELGVIGFVVGVLFLLIAKEVRGDENPPRSGRPEGARLPSSGEENRAPSGRPLREEANAPATREPLGRAMTLRVAAIGVVLGCRDFAGIGCLSLAGIYLQKAHGFDTKHTGAVLGTMMLLSVVVNPTLVWLTAGSKRLPTLRAILVLGGVAAAIIPFFPASLVLLVLCAFQTCQAGSYAISDSALMERISPQARGRVYGLYFSFAGTLGAAGPWIMGFWTDALGDRAGIAASYVLPFAVLGFGMLLASLSPPFIARLGPATQIVEPITETMPATVEPTG